MNASASSRPEPRAPDKRRRDFGIIGRAQENAAMAFASRLPLQRGKRLLDVGCGTGNVSIAAARAGGDVTGVDPREPFLSRARAWAKNEDLLIRFKPARPEKLPFSDGNFHAVVSFLGLPLCDDPVAAAAEMRRVCRRGGTLAVAAWEPEGLVGDMLRLTFRYSGDERLTRALDRSRPEALESWFAGSVRAERVETHEVDLRFPLTPTEVAACHIAFYPPIRNAVESLEPEVREALAAELAELLTETGQAAGDGLRLSTAHHELILRKR